MIRGSIADDRLLCLPIRPVEYWHHHGPGGHGDGVTRHREHGFASVPQPRRRPIDGEITYGDASMTLDRLATIASGWTITDVEWNPCDPLQGVVGLVPS